MRRVQEKSHVILAHTPQTLLLSFSSGPHTGTTKTGPESPSGRERAWVLPSFVLVRRGSAQWPVRAQCVQSVQTEFLYTCGFCLSFLEERYYGVTARFFFLTGPWRQVLLHLCLYIFLRDKNVAFSSRVIVISLKDEVLSSFFLLSLSIDSSVPTLVALTCARAFRYLHVLMENAFVKAIQTGEIANRRESVLFALGENQWKDTLVASLESYPSNFFLSFSKWILCP